MKLLSYSWVTAPLPPRPDMSLTDTYTTLSPEEEEKRCEVSYLDKSINVPITVLKSKCSLDNHHIFKTFRGLVKNVKAHNARMVL